MNAENYFQKLIESLMHTLRDQESLDTDMVR